MLLGLTTSHLGCRLTPSRDNGTRLSPLPIMVTFPILWNFVFYCPNIVEGYIIWLQTGGRVYKIIHIILAFWINDALAFRSFNCKDFVLDNFKEIYMSQLISESDGHIKLNINIKPPSYEIITFIYSAMNVQINCLCATCDW